MRDEPIPLPCPGHEGIRCEADIRTIGPSASAQRPRNRLRAWPGMNPERRQRPPSSCSSVPLRRCGSPEPGEATASEAKRLSAALAVNEGRDQSDPADPGHDRANCWASSSSRCLGAGEEAPGKRAVDGTRAGRSEPGPAPPTASPGRAQIGTLSNVHASAWSRRGAPSSESWPAASETPRGPGPLATKCGRGAAAFSSVGDLEACVSRCSSRENRWSRLSSRPRKRR